MHNENSCIKWKSVSSKDLEEALVEADISHTVHSVDVSNVAGSTDDETFFTSHSIRDVYEGDVDKFEDPWRSGAHNERLYYN
jgi:hypothetical protein